MSRLTITLPLSIRTAIERQGGIQLKRKVIMPERFGGVNPCDSAALKAILGKDYFTDAEKHVSLGKIKYYGFACQVSDWKEEEKKK